MKTIHVSDPLSLSTQNNSEPCVIALGFFDGVHLGHREIIHTARMIAKQKKLKMAVMTFTPQPSVVIQKGKSINKYITPLAMKEKIFKNLGVELLYIVQFTSQVAQISHHEFVDHYLCGLQCKHAVAGFDYTYGFKGKGTMQQLKTDAAQRFEVTIVEKLEKHHHKVSSTRVRELIASGRVEHIPTYLGNQYEMEGVLRQRANGYVFSTDLDYMIPCPGNYEVTIIDGIVVTKGICEVTANDRKGELKLRMIYEQPFADHTAVRLQWDNFIADYDMDVFHAQGHFDDWESCMC